MTTHDETEHNERGIHWTYSQVLRGEAGTILAIELVIVVAILVVLLFLDLDSLPLGTRFAKMFGDLLSLKADLLAQVLCTSVTLSIPLMIVLWPAIGAAVMVYSNWRDRNVERTPEVLRDHDVDVQLAWTWPMSFVVGVFDFSMAFVVCNIALGFFDEVFSETAVKMWTVLFTIVCLVFAERRVTITSRTMSGRWAGNKVTVDALLEGRLDGRLPEEFRNDLGRAKAATVVRCGIVRTPEWAAIVVAGIDLRTKVKLFSGFLNSTIHGVLTAVSFGIAATAANSLGAVSGKFASGKQQECIDYLRSPYGKKPHFIVEVIAVIVCVVLIVLYVAGILPDA